MISANHLGRADGGRGDVEARSGAAHHDEEYHHLRDHGVALVDVEDAHSEDADEEGDDAGDDDAYYYRHSPAGGHGREDLANDEGVDEAVSEHADQL